ncbi:MAG: metallophosphoesterase [Clostridia bacterium]|nr:metallophosphoesterase [Clostridia bacterium]
MLYRDPCVFAVGKEYQIVFNTKEFGIAWVEVGEKQYRDSFGGLMRSETLVHRVALPMPELDKAGKYTVCFRALPERKPYFPELGAEQRREYAFRPIDFSDGLQAVMLADTHSNVEAPTLAADYFGDKLDLVLLNGDIPAESKQMSDLLAIYDLLSNTAGGGRPVVFARGNHDYRGRLAIEMPQYIGNRDGHTYFTFRLGSLWGIVLDCGEDKNDSNVEYGGLVDCHRMRLEETDYIRSVIERAEEEYLAPGVETRICLTHIPFPSRVIEIGQDPIFQIEHDIFGEWTHLLNQMQLDVMLCGHMHRLSVTEPESELARMDVQFPVVVCAEPHMVKGVIPVEGDEPHYICGAFEVTDGKVTVHAVDDHGKATLLWQKTKSE